jgi:hypothetical protein
MGMNDNQSDPTRSGAAEKSDFFRLGILLGLCLLLGTYLIVSTVLISKDGVFYIDQAHRVVDDPVGVAQRYPPGYPFLLWVAHQVARPLAMRDSTPTRGGAAGVLWIRSSQSVTLLCEMLALIPLYFLGKRLVGPQDSLWAVLILILLPYPAQLGAEVLREWPYVLFLSLGFWLLYLGLQEGTRRVAALRARRVAALRGWWAFAGVGLAAGLGYLIRQECAQLLFYGLLGLLPWRTANRGLRMPYERATARDWRRLGGALLLVVGFLVPAAPCIYAAGTVVPHQLRPLTPDLPPVIVSVGGEAACQDPLEFEVAANKLLELPIEVTVPRGGRLTFSLVGVPAGARPVYAFWSRSTQEYFWTAWEYERSLLLATYSQEVWDYEGIPYYAYLHPDARPGLRPVHRFWSDVRHRHLYTIDNAQRQSLLQQATADSWQYEGIAFYAFDAGSRPADAVQPCQFGSRDGKDSPAVEDARGFPAAPDEETRVVTVPWYIHAPGEPPAGMAIRSHTLRWRPGPAGEGQYQVNIIAGNGKRQGCQLIRIRVCAAPGPAGLLPSAVRGPAAASGATRGVRHFTAGLADLPEAVDRVFDATAENLMVVFFVPWLVGLYYRLRYLAPALERVLTTAVVAVNLAFMLARFVWITPGMPRRYGLGLIALTIFYVPVGLHVIAQGLERLFARRRKETGQCAVRPWPWFYILAVIGITVCIPKLVMPREMDKKGFRVVSRWLQENTPANAAIAVPDPRISFYADRQGPWYRLYPDPRNVDYIVGIIDTGEETSAPAGGHMEYSLAVDSHGLRRIVVWKIRDHREPVLNDSRGP